MKSTKQKWIIAILLTVLISGVCVVLFLSKKEVDRKNVTLSNAYLMNGFEQYDDLIKMNNHYGLWGDISISKDEEYITQGKASAKFELNYNSKYGNPDQTDSQLKSGAIRFQTQHYDDKFMYIDKIRTVSFDLYSAHDKEYTIYFAAYADGNECLYSDGTVIAANSWNYVTFDLNAHMFEKDTVVKEYFIYFDGLDELSDKKRVFYIDNVRAEIMDEEVEHVAGQFLDDSTGKEILRFDNSEDDNYIHTRINATSNQYVPFIYANYDKTNTQFSDNGGLRVDLDYARRKADLWDDDVVGYEIEIAKARIERIENPSKISLTINNPSSVVHKVSLVLESEEKESVANVTVPAGEEVVLVLDKLHVSSIDNLLIRIECRTLVNQSCLYFKDLVYSE